MAEHYVHVGEAVCAGCGENWPCPPAQDEAMPAPRFERCPQCKAVAPVHADGCPVSHLDQLVEEAGAATRPPARPRVLPDLPAPPTALRVVRQVMQLERTLERVQFALLFAAACIYAGHKLTVWEQVAKEREA